MRCAVETPHISSEYVHQCVVRQMGFFVSGLKFTKHRPEIGNIQENLSSHRGISDLAQNQLYFSQSHLVSSFFQCQDQHQFPVSDTLYVVKRASQRC